MVFELNPELAPTNVKPLQGRPTSQVCLQVLWHDLEIFFVNSNIIKLI